jgi:hypothetical protein
MDHHLVCEFALKTRQIAVREVKEPLLAQEIPSVAAAVGFPKGFKN